MRGRGIRDAIAALTGSLRAKVLALLLGGLSVAFAAIITIQSVSEYRHALDLLEASVRDQTQLIAGQSRRGLALRDEAFLEHVFFDLVFRQDERTDTAARIGMLQVFDHSGLRLKSFATFPGPDLDAKLLRAAAAEAMALGHQVELPAGDLFILASPANSDVDMDVLGAVAIAWDTTDLKARLLLHAVRQALIGLGAAIAVTTMLLIAINRLMLAPTMQLTRTMASMRPFDTYLIPRSLRSRNDEIGRLANEFAGLMEQLRASREALIERSELEIGMRNQQLDAALNNMSEGLCMFDGEGNLVVNNRQVADLYNLSPDVFDRGMSLRDLMCHAQDAGSFTGEDIDLVVADLTDEHVSSQPRHHYNRIRDGRVVSVNQVPLDSGGWVFTFSDITERRLAEARIEHMAHHDDLTGLPNRSRFRDEIAHAMKQVQRGQKFAVYCLDLDRFKAVNDTLGHPVGDELLIQVAERLQLSTRETDVVARLGGDEFAILQPVEGDEEMPITLANRVITALSQPYHVSGHQIVIGASVGVALAPYDSSDADGLMKAADLALYRAKGDGRGVARLFEREMDARMQERRRLEIDLRAALENGDIEVSYQPIVDIESNKVRCFEALARWHHAERGQIPPDVFIPLAEEIGLIDKIGAHVLSRACTDAATWPETIRVAVNLSPAQFATEALVDDVEETLIRTGLTPDRLELEITETALLNQTDTTLTILARLRHFGVRIAMDDFGTGYSSLAYLRKFPFDKIKIDRSFISELEGNDESQAIVRAIIGLGSSLGIATTAEGVETSDQLAKLRAEGCQEVQGWLFSKAVPANQITLLLKAIEHWRDTAA
ncbi:diguanylate cyclase (GGDEF) domain-containing protein [Poseidonocella pacifica]|uniref:Diguanylate cyclase (GGDEF) domain-containing protein n=1 Tax=Poseidonocella pacifica TaxID=871651 RepID=A0A1I0X942_9RHOB|nr:EAL domain-containing protein [Poseidonocella pacifica]SFA96860.1 diguanylate cyclase (GGDEF) domain-containing protein [Poseidonocella pacifica]